MKCPHGDFDLIAKVSRGNIFGSLLEFARKLKALSVGDLLQETATLARLHRDKIIILRLLIFA